MAWGCVLGDYELAIGDGLFVGVRLEEPLLHVNQVAVDSEGGEDRHAIKPVAGRLKISKMSGLSISCIISQV